MATPAKLCKRASSSTSVEHKLPPEPEGRPVKSFRIWYKHRRQSYIRRIPSFPEYKTFYDEKEIIECIGKANVSHLSIENGLVPSLERIALKLRILDIRGLNQTSQLHSLPRLPELKELFLSGNDFSSGLPPIIGAIKSLEKLDIDRCQLKGLPNSLSHLRELKELHASENNFSGGPPEVIGELSGLEVLYLRNCQLSGLPQNFNQLTHLKDLYLTNNDFSSGLPKVIGEIKRLEKLHLFRSKLNSLPESLSQPSHLKELQLTNNNFSKGLPPVVAQISSLTKLSLSGCKLTGLPQCLSQLSKLRDLNLSDNNFASGLPSVIGELSGLIELSLNRSQLKSLPKNLVELKHLKVLKVGSNKLIKFPSSAFKGDLKSVDLSHNSCLEEVEDLTHLKKLDSFACEKCYSLSYPPYSVCQQGFQAVKQYFADLTSGIQKTVVPVAVIGRSMSGKTSLIRSLQNGKRSLTNRTTVSRKDESTKVFHIEDLQLSSSHLKLIDYGGHEVYHIAYRMMVKEQHLPIIVVNMEDFARCVESSGPKQATQDVCFDWLSHLFLACPRLVPPILVITHLDKIKQDDVQVNITSLLKMIEELRKEALAESEYFSAQQRDLHKLLHFHDMQVDLFDSKDIFQFSDATDVAYIESFIHHLDRRCQEFNVVIPRLWEEVVVFVRGQRDKSLVSLTEIVEKYPSESCKVVLRYMHNTGDVLWFENDDMLKEYIFHKPLAIAELIGVLFHHCAKERWDQRLKNFTRFQCGKEWINRDKYKQLIQEFQRSGILDRALLMNLFERESIFPSEVALALLKCFCVLHGPIEQKPRGAFVIPYFATNPVDDSWKTNGELQLRLDMIFGGLRLPHYVHHLITASVLNECYSPYNNFQVASDGATIYSGDITTYLIHQRDGQKLTLQVSTSSKWLAKSWCHLLKLTKCVASLLSESWKACYICLKFYCAHCLFLRDPAPSLCVDPDWYDQECLGVRDDEWCQGIEPVTCDELAAHTGSMQPTVPRPLRFPTSELTADEVESLQTYLSDIELDRFQSEPDVAMLQSNTAEGDDSDLSDVGDYCNETPCDKASCDKASCDRISEPKISLRLKSVKKQIIKQLYNSDEVYKMSDKVRGRALIINQRRGRDGSSVDYDNVSTLFRQMKFDIVKNERELTDLTVEEINKTIKEETQVEAHKRHGMFVLVMMSYGSRGDILRDTLGNPVDLVAIRDLLNPENFPAMRGKPKLLIIQACSGDRMDVGGAKGSKNTANAPPSLPSVPNTGRMPTPTTSADSTVSHGKGTGTSLTPVTHDSPSEGTPNDSVFLNADDFFIMKASDESYVAIRSRTLGSWFIRLLVVTFYHHAHSRDIDELFKIVQRRVRKVSLTNSLNSMGGSVPVSKSTLTKKLYLFPGYPSTLR